MAHESLGDAVKAADFWSRAAAAGVRGGRRPNPAAAYHRGLALGKLGRPGEAKAVFEELLASGAPYAAGLGHAGLGDREKARAEFERVLKTNPAHVGARSALADLR
jgi:tetratricopeptide (TPR) repeat protein